MPPEPDRLKTQIGTWYVCDRPRYRLKIQYELGKPFGMKEGGRDVYREGVGAETLEAAVKGSRNKVVGLVGGFRVLGETRKQIMDAYAPAKAAGGILFDPLSGLRSDRDSAEMLDRALAGVHAEMRMPPGGFEEAGRKGGHNRWKKLAESRVAVGVARKAWFDLSQFKTDAAVVAFLGPGWSRSSLLNKFGKSGRRVGRRPEAAAALNNGYVGPGDIYFVRAGKDRVKIGFSNDHVSRFSALKTGNAHELKMIGIVPGTHQDEKAMHKRFAAYRVRGEWFKIEGELAAFLKKVEAANKVTRKRSRR